MRFYAGFSVAFQCDFDFQSKWTGSMAAIFFRKSVMSITLLDLSILFALYMHMDPNNCDSYWFALGIYGTTNPPYDTKKVARAAHARGWNKSVSNYGT